MLFCAWSAGYRRISMIEALCVYMRVSTDEKESVSERERLAGEDRGSIFVWRNGERMEADEPAREGKDSEREKESKAGGAYAMQRQQGSVTHLLSFCVCFASTQRRKITFCLSASVYYSSKNQWKITLCLSASEIGPCTHLMPSSSSQELHPACSVRHAVQRSPCAHQRQDSVPLLDAVSAILALLRLLPVLLAHLFDHLQPLKSAHSDQHRDCVNLM